MVGNESTTVWLVVVSEVCSASNCAIPFDILTSGVVTGPEA